jgi:hypothetical protein
MGNTSMFSKRSLRRALWRARLATRSFFDPSHAAGSPERQATLYLRQKVRADAAGSVVHPVPKGWQSEVLKRDPGVACARSEEDLALLLETPEAFEVFAPGELHLAPEQVRSMFRSGTGEGRTVFVEVE